LPNGDRAIDYVIDTLGRTIDFAYQNSSLVKVRQCRNASCTESPDTWYNFIKIDYVEVFVSTNFGTMTTDPTTITSVWLPSRIDYPTGHNYRFYYTSYAQMYLIEKWAPTVTGQGNERRIAYTYYNIPTKTTSYPGVSSPAVTVDTNAQTDSPRFTQRKEQAESWNGGNEAIYNYEFAADNSYSKITDPIGRIFRTDFYTYGSPVGLLYTQKVFANSTTYPSSPLKTTTFTWGWDTGFSYLPNVWPSKIEIVDNQGYRRATGYSYNTTTINGVALPENLDEYQNDGVTVYRRTKTTYSNNTNYTSRHIYGLPTTVEVFSGPGTTLIAKNTFSYDEASYFDTTGYTATNHDAANYGTGFTWRGNLTTVTQFEVPGVGSRAVSHTKYDMTGMVSAVYDGANHVTQLYYADNYSNKPGGVGETHALVTKIKDPDSYWNGAQYNYYTGLVTQGYHIQGTSGAGAQENTVTYGYDSADRLNAINQPAGHGGQMTRAYWDNWLAVATYTLIDAGKTRYNFIAYTRAGQTRWYGGDHPDGVSGKYWMQQFAYDAVGRTTSVSNLTAIDGNYSPNHPEWDEDYYFGWLYTTISYDELDRRTFVTRPDSHTVQYRYTGCGCAGSSTVTVTDERGKKRKVVYDFLGRLAEAHDLTSAGATYGKAVYSYDTRDLLTTIAHYNSGSAHQDRTFGYDGYGRLQIQTTPEGGTVSYDYYADDLVWHAYDPRGINATFTYNNRHLLTDVNYSDSTPDVHYNYGEYGERTLMEEKNGATVIASTSYGYDTYKRLQTETRSFQGLSGSYSLSYTYNYVDAPKRITYTVGAWSKNVNYDYNYAGSLAGVGTNLIGTNPNDTTNVASGFDYRAFPALQSVNYGNTRKMTLGYNQLRSQMTSLQVKRNDGTDPIINLGYDYYNGGGGSNGNNGRIRHIDDYLDGLFSADFGYDDHNRLTSYGPNHQRSYTYDEWGNLRTVSSTTGGGEAPSYTLSYANNATGAPLNNRINNAGYSYDQAGNMTSDGNVSYTYDAANRLKTAGTGNSCDYDGDGRKVKQVSGGYPLYYLWSSVLGEPVVELDSLGGVYRVYVYSPGGQMIALQSYDYQFYWVHGDHLGSGRKLTNTSGTVVYRAEFDPHGQTLYEWASGGATFLNSHKFTGYERDWATNLNCAKARAYYHNRGRFMQADPLGVGAADATNPQSLNRYSYVGNDPANYVDPNGLRYILVCNRVWENGESSENCFWVDVPEWGWTEPRDPGIGGGGGQAHQQQQDNRTDCQRFADMVEQIANDASGVEDFFDRMARTFTAANNSSVGEMRRTANNALPAGRPIFGSSGFKQQFRDPSNQVRHFVGGLIAGFRLGHVPALTFMNSREMAGVDDADIALNSESTWMGHNYGAHPGSKAHDAYGGYRKLANAIRRRICE
jgi:RHS repeat-associated protein